jgi:hypothetical protein
MAERVWAIDQVMLRRTAAATSAASSAASSVASSAMSSAAPSAASITASLAACIAGPSSSASLSAGSPAQALAVSDVLWPGFEPAARARLLMKHALLWCRGPEAYTGFVGCLTAAGGDFDAVGDWAPREPRPERADQHARRVSGVADGGIPRLTDVEGAGFGNLIKAAAPSPVWLRTRCQRYVFLSLSARDGQI